MKASPKKLKETPQTDVFPKTLHRLRANPKADVPGPKSKKRDNIFSKSRDTREDRGERKIKTSNNAQTFPHGGR
jgi:hypothetical protein